MADQDFDALRKGHLEARCQAAVKALERRMFEASWFSSVERAVDHVLEIIPEGSRVGAGGSVTLRETGTLEALSARGDEVIHHRQEMAFEESLLARKQAIVCPYYLVSANAVTMEGELVNLDGIGNRVAGMIFGPQTVIVLAGANKIVEDREEAFCRIRNISAPANARRLGVDVPCVERGRCTDCKSPMNICRVWTIMSHPPMLTHVKVILIAEPLGL